MAGNLAWLWFAEDSGSRVQPGHLVCDGGQWCGALKGGERERFDFDYLAKIHFLLVMTGWGMLEITATLLDSPSVISPQWSDVSLEITPGEMRRDMRLSRPAFALQPDSGYSEVPSPAQGSLHNPRDPVMFCHSSGFLSLTYHQRWGGYEIFKHLYHLQRFTECLVTRKVSRISQIRRVTA